jgi:phosphoribosylformimino-5-aminoimidazole carboxamide ribonucleotide (ProFAR) isomerase
VTFEVLPAIDVAAGRLVSVSGGAIRDIDAFGGSPLAAAETFAAAGARWLHVVDVDRARDLPPDPDLLARLASVGVLVQASGGIETRRAADEALGAGATRVVLGSGALLDRDAASEAIAALHTRVVVGIEADGERIRPRSSGARDLPLAPTLAWLRTLRPAGFLYTGVSRVAGLEGPDLEGARTSATALGGPVLVAGGIRDLDDVEGVRALGPDRAAGCVVGRALYEGIDLRAVLAAAS